MTRWNVIRCFPVYAFSLLVVAAACSDDTSAPDGGADSGLDVTAQDAAPADSAPQDTNAPDTNMPDTNMPDTNMPDTNMPDTGSEPITGVMTPEARELYNRIMTYRASAGLPSIPVSEGLTRVAQAHVWDSYTNNPHQGNCNLHSWSNSSDWGGCCYTPDHANAQCMWDKPREISSYSGNGYEISAGGGGNISPEVALSLWQRSSGHDDVIMNRGIWGNPWGAIGVAIDRGYAHVWFGREAPE